MPELLRFEKVSHLASSLFIASLAALGSVTLLTSEASAHWYGFTGEEWYHKASGPDPGCNTFEQSNGDYSVLVTNNWLPCQNASVVIHSYGFSSATNVSASAQGTVCARARRQSDGTNVFLRAAATTLCRPATTASTPIATISMELRGGLR
jgi:hypothetical protein